ncbi:Asx homology domain-containing protein [Trametes elegans]|nr:Asx homology domain-containing protein [Trametes elegans]
MEDATSSKATTPARPRRSARTPAKVPYKTNSSVATPSSPVQGKRKARDAGKSPAEKLEYLLTNTKSKLTQVDISDLINYPNLLELSGDAQKRLCALLPPTAFSTYTPIVCPTHPDYAAPSPEHPDNKAMDVDDSAADARAPARLDPTVFTSPFFLSAAHTFQDHLFSGWLGKKAADDVAKFREGARTGNMHADWKDELWEREQRPAAATAASKRKRPPALDIALLAKRRLLQAGDVLAYHRAFPAQDVTVEKDLLVESIDPQTHAPTFLLTRGTQRALHTTLLPHDAADSAHTERVLSIEAVTDPLALERGVLDVDGRVRATGAGTTVSQNDARVRAWKAFTVWRWREEVRDHSELQLLQERGGREKVATLFYLRGCCSSNS